MEQGAVFGQLGLGLLPIRDIGVRAGHAQRTSVSGTSDDLAAVEDPPPLAGLGTHSILGLKPLGGPIVETGAKRFIGRKVVRMDEAKR